MVIVVVVIVHRAAPGDTGEFPALAASVGVATCDMCARLRAREARRQAGAVARRGVRSHSDTKNAGVGEDSLSGVPEFAWDSLPDGWRTYLAHDFGSAAPSATYVFAVSPGDEVAGRYYPRNSLVVVDELATNKRGSLNTGNGWTVPVRADAIKGMCARWAIYPRGVADDACFARGGHAAGSIADEFEEYGVYFDPVHKADRLTGWNGMRRLLAQAGEPARAGLYVSRACEYFWAAVPSLPRDPKRIEDVDSSGSDHAADAVRYGCLRHATGYAPRVVWPM